MAMIQRPNAVGLFPCREIVVEDRTRNVTLVNTFKSLHLGTFPSLATPFVVYTVLTDGIGDVKLELTISRGDTLEEIYHKSYDLVFDDPLYQLRLWWQIKSCNFPQPGLYQVTLLGSRELIAQCVFMVT